MICLVPDIKETYENLKLLFDLTELNKIPFKFVLDNKVVLISAGLQTATATYPCPYCDVTLKMLRGQEPLPETFTYRTFGNIKDCYSKYNEEGGKKGNAKFC